MAKKKGNQATALPTSDAETDAEHGKLIGWVNEADTNLTASRELSEKARAYYDSDQWSDAEKAKLQAQKQAATVINRCKPKVDSLMGMERANRTTAKAYPRTPKHTKGAEAATEAVRFCLEDNMFERCRSDAWENMLIEGSGGVEIIARPAKGDTFKIVIRQIMWDRMIWDAHSRRKDFSDARYLGQVVWMDYDEALALYPEAKDHLESIESNSATWEDKPKWMDGDRRRVKIVELYYRKDNGEWWYACFTRGGYCKAPMKSPYLNEEGETESAYEFASLFVDREGGRYGSLKQVLDVQDEINKRRSKALHLMSVRQTFGTAGAVADVNKARAELAKPDGHVEFAYGELNKDFGVLPTGDMAQAQFNLLTEAKMEMDLVGANSATQGKDKTVQSGVALRQREMTGQTELAPMFDMLKNLDIRIYRKTWNRIKQYWKGEMWLRVTDDENNLKFVGLNKPVTQGEQVMQQAQAQMQAENMPPDQQQQTMQVLQQKLATDPMMKEVVSTENDIVSLDVDIVMDDAPDTVTQEVEDFQAMAEMVKSGFPIPPEAVIMASPLSNKDKIIKMMKEKPQMPPEAQKQMEGMQDQLKKQQEEMQKLQQENQQLQQNNAAEVAKAQADGQAELQKGEIKKKQLEQEFLLKKQAQDQQAELDRAAMLDKAQLDRDAARQDALLAHAKALDEFNLKAEAMERESALKQKEAAAGESGKAQDAKEDKATPAALTKLGEMLSENMSMNRELLKAVKSDKKVSMLYKDGRPAGATVTMN